MAKSIKIKEQFRTAPLYWITGIALAASISAYIWRFHAAALSGDPEKWGQLGDYIGGLINPLAALLNVYVAIQIAREVSKFGEQQTEQQLKVQRELSDLQVKVQKDLTDQQVNAQKEVVKNELLYEILRGFQNDILSAHAAITYAIKEEKPLEIKPNVQKSLVIMDGFLKYYSTLFFIPRGLALKIVVDYQSWLGPLNVGHHNRKTNDDYDSKIKLSIDLLISIMYASVIGEAKMPAPKPVPKEQIEEWEKKFGVKLPDEPHE